MKFKIPTTLPPRPSPRGGRGSGKEGSSKKKSILSVIPTNYKAKTAGSRRPSPTATTTAPSISSSSLSNKDRRIHERSISSSSEIHQRHALRKVKQQQQRSQTGGDSSSSISDRKFESDSQTYLNEHQILEWENLKPGTTAPDFIPESLQPFWAAGNAFTTLITNIPEIIVSGATGNGYHYPGTSYIGPGTPVHLNPAPVSQMDDLARIHDWQYSQLVEKGVNPYFTFNEADRYMMNHADLTTAEGWAVYVGIGMKQIFKDDYTSVDPIPPFDPEAGADQSIGMGDANPGESPEQIVKRERMAVQRENMIAAITEALQAMNGMTPGIGGGAQDQQQQQMGIGSLLPQANPSFAAPTPTPAQTFLRPLLPEKVQNMVTKGVGGRGVSNPVRSSKQKKTSSYHQQQQQRQTSTPPHLLAGVGSFLGMRRRLAEGSALREGDSKASAAAQPRSSLHSSFRSLLTAYSPLRFRPGEMLGGGRPRGAGPPPALASSAANALAPNNPASSQYMSKTGRPFNPAQMPQIPRNFTRQSFAAPSPGLAMTQATTSLPSFVRR